MKNTIKVFEPVSKTATFYSRENVSLLSVNVMYLSIEIVCGGYWKMHTFEDKPQLADWLRNEMAIDIKSIEWAFYE